MPDEKMKYPLLEFEYDKKLYEELLTLNPHPEFMDRVSIVTEDYEHDDFGSLPGDEKNALGHAAGVLWKIQKYGTSFSDEESKTILIGLALNEIDLVHRQGKLTSHKSVDGVLLGVRLQAGHDRKLLGVQSLLDIFTDHGSREPDGQHELTGAAGEQGGTCNSSSGQTGDLYKVTERKIHNETLLVIA